MHPGDLAPQFKLAWKNLIEVLAAAEMTPQNIVRLNFYTRFLGLKSEDNALRFR